MADEIKQPPLRGGRTAGVGQFHSGAKRSVARLKQLNYDPIGELVANYRKLQAEVERQEKIRDGAIVELTSTGRTKAYRAEVHHALYDKLITIGDKLLRYGYGRVPETTIVEDRKPMPLVVNLTKKGEVYTVNEDAMPDRPMLDIDEDDGYE